MAANGKWQIQCVVERTCVFVLCKFIWGRTHTLRVSYSWVCGSSIRSGLLYGTDDYMKAPHIVHSGANFTVCFART